MFLTQDSLEAFIDFPKKEAKPDYGLTKECPKCLGHGGWNLRVNAYPLHRYQDTAINRHLYSHFRCCCDNCNGWGYVPESQTCVHSFERGGSIAMCQSEFVCKQCNEKIIVDSSD